MSKKEASNPKIGAGHAQAMLRQGLAELRGALYNENTVAQPTQYGIYGTKTPGEVAKDRETSGHEQTLDQEPQSVLDEHVKRAESLQGRDPDRDRSRERETPEMDR